MSTLVGSDAIHMATVLEDCIDQLVILGRIMPVAYKEKQSATQMVSDDIAQLVGSQQQLEKNTDDVTQTKSSSGQGDGHKASRKVGNNAAILAYSLKQNPLAPDNLEKVQEDRSFLEEILYKTMMEIRAGGTFNSLAEAIKKEKDSKLKMEEIITKEEESRKRVRELQRKIAEVKHEREVESQKRSEMVAHLKDQLQEMKAKTSMEGKYVKKLNEVNVSQTQKRCQLTEQTTQNEIEELKFKIDEESRVNAEIHSFLHAHIEERQELLQYWIDKHEHDVDAKQRELDLLKAAKAKDLERLQELTRLYAEYEQVVVEDRIEREKIRRRKLMEAKELANCIKIQAWWRGTMVRRCLGPYKKKKKKGGKGKDEKKDDKGKKK